MKKKRLQVYEQGPKCNSVDWWEALVRVPSGMRVKRGVYYALEGDGSMVRVSAGQARDYVPGGYIYGGLEDAAFYLQNRRQRDLRDPSPPDEEILERLDQIEQE